MSAQPNNVRSLLKSEIHQIKLAKTEFAEISLIDRNGNEVARIEFLRDIEATPQLQVTYYNEQGNITQSATTYDVDA